MANDPRVGTLASAQDVVDLSKLTQAFFDRKPDVRCQGSAFFSECQVTVAHPSILLSMKITSSP
jgi:hypothetical protein